MSNCVYQSGSALINTYGIVTASAGAVTLTNNLNIPNVLAFGSLNSSSQTQILSLFTGTAPMTFSNGTVGLSSGTPGAVVPDAAPSSGSAATVALSDHTHGITCMPPIDNIGASLSEGTALYAARSDHGHIGMRSLSVPLNTQIYGDVLWAASGGSSVTFSGQSIVLGLTLAAFTLGTCKEWYVLQETKGNGVAGGAYSVASTWTNRGITSLTSFGGTNVALTSSASTNTTFVLQPGTYYIRAVVPCVATGLSKARLYDTTTSQTILVGCAVSPAGLSIIDGSFTVSAADTLALQFWGQTKNTSTTAFGVAVGDGVNGEIYSSCRIIKGT